MWQDFLFFWGWTTSHRVDGSFVLWRTFDNTVDSSLHVMPLNWSSSPNLRIPYTGLSPQRALSEMTRPLSYLKSVGLWNIVIPWHSLQCLLHVAPSLQLSPPPCRPSVQAGTPLPNIHHMPTRLHLPAFVHQMPVPEMSETTTCEALLDPPSSRLSVNQTKKSLARELASCV